MPGPSLAAALLAVSLSATPGVPIRPPVVLVSGGAHFGSGIVWNASAGVVLTALHVVEQMPEIWISAGGGAALRARVVDADPALDLALLRADGPLPPAAPLGRRVTAATAGEPAFLVGFPGRRANAVAGKILDPARRFAGARYLEIGACAEPGTSGGAVLDAHGAVVGVVDLVLTDRDSTLAVPIDAALARFGDHAGRDGDGGGEPPIARAGPALPPASVQGASADEELTAAGDAHPPLGLQSTVSLISQLYMGSRTLQLAMSVPPTGLTAYGSTPSARDVAGSSCPVLGRPWEDWNSASAERVGSSHAPVGSTWRPRSWSAR